MLANLCIYALDSLNVNYVRRRLAVMKLIEILLILITFFIGLSCIIYICSKNKCIFTYMSKKRKIEIYPLDKSHQSHR